MQLFVAINLTTQCRRHSVEGLNVVRKAEVV